MATVLIEQNVPALMRDGVTLFADVYRPAGDGRHPVLVSRTPYGKAGMDRSGNPLRMAQAGYAVVVQVTSSSFPRWDRNWNTRENPSVATSGRPAEQAIWHDASHPSRVLLPEVHAT